MVDVGPAERTRLDQLLRQRERERSEFLGSRETDRRQADQLLRQRTRERVAQESPPWQTGRLMVRRSELGEPGLPDLDVRASLGIRETVQERQEAFRRAFPQGEIRDAMDERGRSFRVFRRDPSEPWRQVDPNIVEKFEPLQDIADVTGDVLPIIGEVVTTRGAGGTLRQGIRAAGGAAGGHLVEEAGELAVGQQREDLGQIFKTAGLEGMAAGAGTVATGPLSLLMNVRHGVRNVTLMPGAQEAIEAEARQDLPALTAPQLVVSPIIRRIGTYGETFSTAMQQHVFDQQNAAASRLGDLSIPGATDLPLYTRAGVAAREGELLEMLQRPRATLPPDWQQAGTALQQGLEEWNTVARLEIDDLYRTARDIEEPTFNMVGLKAAANNALRRGVIVTGEAGDRTARPMAPLAGELQAVLRDIRRFNGKPKTITMPDGEQVTLSATDQLRSFRERLWDLKTVDPGQIARRPEADAAFFYEQITDVLDNPQGSDEFLRAWSDASQAAKNRFDIWDATVIRTLKGAEDLDNLARNYVRPNQRYALQAIKEVVPANRWNEFRQIAIDHLLSDPRRISQRLEEFDQPTLNVFLQPREKAAIRTIGEGMDRLEAARGLLDLPRWRDMGRAVLNAPDARTAVSMEEIGGKFSPSGMRLRAAILDTVIETVVEQGRQGPTVNRTALNAVLTKIRNNGADRFLTASDIEVLTDLHRYLAFAGRDAADMGASLMGSEQTLSAVREFSISAIVNIAQTIGMGDLLISPAGRRLLVGSGGTVPTYNNLRLAGAAIGTLASSFEESEEEARRRAERGD